MISNFIKGFSYLFSGFSMITQKGIRRFALIPLLVNIVVFSIAIKVGLQQFAQIMDSLRGVILGWLPSWLDWLATGVEWVLYPIFVVLIVIAVYYTFTMVANIIAAPFNAILAQRVEAKLLGKEIEFEDATVLSVIGRTLASEGKKLFHMLKWLVLLLIITFIPVVNVAAPFAWMLYGAWMLSLEYADYPMGNHELYFKDEIARLKKNKFRSLGFGSGVMLMTAIPVVNFFAMPVGVAAGTAYWVDRLKAEEEG